MTTLLEAMKMMVEALENCTPISTYYSDQQLEDALVAGRAAIEAAEKQEPVDNDVRYLRKWLNEELTAPIDRQSLARVLTSITHPAPAIPEGWQLVPKEPTAEMCSYMNIGIHHTICERIYKAMLQVAPEPVSKTASKQTQL